MALGQVWQLAPFYPGPGRGGGQRNQRLARNERHACSKARPKASSSSSPAPAHGRPRTRAALEAQIDGETARRGTIKRVDIDMGRVERLDTFGAWLLERLMRSFSARGCDTKVTGLKDDYRALMDEVHGVKPDAGAGAAGGNQLADALASIGENIARGRRHRFAAIVNMLGALVVALLRVVVHPRTFRFTSMVHQLDNVGWRAVPIILLITFLIGCIIAQQGIFHFRKFGADIYVVDMVGILVLRETRRADRLHHGGRPLRQRLHRRARLHEDARGDRRAAHHGLRSDRGADPAAHRGADHRRADPHLPRLDGGALWRRPGVLALWRHRPRHLPVAAEGGDHARPLQGRHDQGAVHGAGDRRGRLRRRARRSRAARNRSACRPPPRWWNRSSW